MSEVTVGDLDSNQIGSGARMNGGKDPLDLIPVRYWIELWDGPLYAHIDQPRRWYDLLEALAAFQCGDDEALIAFLSRVELDDAVAVFEYGAKKYKAWNWAKGMPWSVPLGCILRHARASLEYDECIDSESMLPHWGHALCNMIMLDWYVTRYPAGDDRPIFEDPDDVQASVDSRRLPYPVAPTAKESVV